MACTTLSGLLQCQFIPLDSSLQTQLQTLSQTCIPKARGELASTGTCFSSRHFHTRRQSQQYLPYYPSLSQGNCKLRCFQAYFHFPICVSARFHPDLVRRHAGVLGLSACILSSPYDVPQWMPQILMELSDHLNDPQPIEVRRYTQTRSPESFDLKQYNFIVQLRRKLIFSLYLKHEEYTQCRSKSRLLLPHFIV